MQRNALAGLIPVTLAGLLSATLAASVAAQNPSIVTEAEFLSVLDDRHPAVALRTEELAVARAGSVAASTLDNPVLGLVREDPDGPAAQADWTLSWQLPGASRGPEIAARREAAGAAEARLAHDLVTLRSTLREVYATWAVAVARRDLLTVQQERVEALAARVEARAERGEASDLEARRLALAASTLRSRVVVAAAAAERARADARAWYPDLPGDAEPELPSLPPAPELREEHPLVQAARSDLAAATLEGEAAGRFVRSPEILVGWQRQELEAGSVDGPLLGVSWSVPLFDRNRAERAVAAARVTAAEAHLELTRRRVDAARKAARKTYERLTRQLDEAVGALDGVERILDGTEAAFRHGEASLTDLLETRRSVTESELAALDLRAAALAAHRELERLASAGDPATQPNSVDPEEHSR